MWIDKCQKMRLLLILFTVLLSISASATEKESTRDRIQRHREWLNQRRVDRKKLENYVETNDPYQKIKYFKKLIKFKSNDNPNADEVSFVPHLSELEQTRIENYNNKSRAEHEEDEDSSTIVIEAGNEFAYETISNNNENYVTDIAKNTSLVGHLENKAITGSNEKHEDEKSSVIVVTSHKNLIEKEANDGRKTKNNAESQKGTDRVLKNSKKSENQTTNDLKIQKFLSEHLKYRDGDMTMKKSWGKWSSWSNCSRSCGKGVKSQSRSCMLKMYKNGKRINITTIEINECIGFFKRFHICNEEDCPQSSIDFRAQQCSEFNDHTFKNQTYEWEPYVKEDAECELNCRPKNQKYFARLKEHVIDGTSCSKDPKTHTDYEYAVCVEGKCKAVFSNGAISGSFINSGNVRCGNSICKPISGIFAKNPLSNGYIHVATIPTGASNITITELENSINLIALKSAESKFIINGNYTASPSGTYEVSGTILRYHKLDGNVNAQHKRTDGVTEWITILGPLLEPVHLMVLSQETNPGVKYEYLLPTPLVSSDESSDTDYFSSGEDNIPINSKLKAANSKNVATGSKKRRKLTWRVIGFTQCSKTCGGGTQQPIIRCTRGENSKAYSPKKCAHIAKPNVNENLMKCNSQPCPAYWKLGEWSTCDCGEEDEKLNKTREVKCVQELISGVVIQVNSGACDVKPIHSLQCECVVRTTKAPPKVEVYKKNPSILQHTNTQSDQKIYGKQKPQKPLKHKKHGMWLTSDWSETCVCGLGQQFRTIFCDRTLPNNERCDMRQTPNKYRECEMPDDCVGEWFIGPWSPCEGDCFSNTTKTRTVICIKNNGFAEENDCDLKNKPATFEDCKFEDMKDCRPKWHISEWSECSKPCGNGFQKRIIKCLEVDRTETVMRESKNCKYSERPQIFRYCNSHDCSENTTEYDSKFDVIQNDDPSCQDKFSNCNMVHKSKLCGYHYYNENCCQTCRMISNELY